MGFTIYESSVVNKYLTSKVHSIMKPCDFCKLLLVTDFLMLMNKWTYIS